METNTKVRLVVELENLDIVQVLRTSADIIGIVREKYKGEARIQFQVRTGVSLTVSESSEEIVGTKASMVIDLEDSETGMVLRASADIYDMVNKQHSEVARVEVEVKNPAVLGAGITPAGFMEKSVKEIGLSERVANILIRGRIDVVAQLLEKSYDDLEGMTNMGPHSIQHIQAILASHGLQLREKE